MRNVKQVFNKDRTHWDLSYWRTREERTLYETNHYTRICCLFFHSSGISSLGCAGHSNTSEERTTSTSSTS